MYSKLVLTTEAGKLQTWDNGKVETLFHQKEMGGAMGLILTKSYYIVNTPSFLYKIDRTNNKILKKSNKINGQFHHMNIYGDRIYVSGTQTNSIYIFDKELKHIKTHKIPPPAKKKPVAYKTNYNHINTIIKYGGKFYINLNWFTSTQYGMSGVAVFDKQFKELERFQMGWESHDFQFIDEKPIVICATSKPNKNINHPKQSGIMLDGKLIWEHDSTESFCKGLTWDNKYYYLCGGAKADRKQRGFSKGIIYIIDRQTNELVEKITHPDIYNIKGCRILNDG